MTSFYRTVIPKFTYTVSMLIALTLLTHGETNIQKLHQQISLARKELSDSHQKYITAAKAFETTKASFETSCMVAKPIQNENKQVIEKISEIDHYYYMLQLPEAIDKELITLVPFVKAGKQAYEESQRLNTNDQKEKKLISENMALYLKDKIILRNETKQKREAGEIVPPSFIPNRSNPAEYKKELEAKSAEIALRLTPLERTCEQNGLAKNSAHSLYKRLTFKRNQQLVKYYKLLVEMDRNYRPAYTTEIIAKSSVTGKTIYQATYENSEKLKELENQINFYMDNLEVMENEVANRKKMYAKTETRFKESWTKWRQKYHLSTDLMENAYMVNIGIELTDVMIGAALDGVSPAGLLFEAGFRTVDAFRKDFRLPDPTVPKSLVELRNKIAHTTTPRWNGKERKPPQLNKIETIYRLTTPEIDRWKNLNDATSLFNPDAQLEELIKGGLNNASTLFFDGLSQSLAKDVKQFHNTSLPQIMAAFMVNPNLEWNDYIKVTRGKPIEKFEHLARLVKHGVPDQGSAIINRLTESKTYKDAGKGFVVGAMVTAAKGPVMDWAVNNERAKVAAELVMLDMTWMIRRMEYHAAGSEYRSSIAKLEGYLSTLGKLITERDQMSRKRKHKIITNIEASTTEPITIILTFSKKPPADLVLFAKISPSGNGLGFKNTRLKTIINGHTATANISKDPLKDGQLGIITTAPPASFDHDPSTVARYAQDSPEDTKQDKLWLNGNRAGYMSDTIKITKPILTILNLPKKGYFLGGNPVDIRATLSESLIKNKGTLVIYKDKKKIEQIALNNGKKINTIRIKAPEKPGLYRIKWALQIDDQKSMKTVIIAEENLNIYKEIVKHIGPVQSPIPPMPMVTAVLRPAINEFVFPGEKPSATAEKRKKKWDAECKKEKEYWITIHKKDQAFQKKWVDQMKQFTQENDPLKQQETARSLNQLKKAWVEQRKIWKKEGLKLVPEGAKSYNQPEITPIQPIEPIQPLPEP